MEAQSTTAIGVELPTIDSLEGLETPIDGDATFDATVKGQTMKLKDRRGSQTFGGSIRVQLPGVGEALLQLTAAERERLARLSEQQLRTSLKNTKVETWLIAAALLSTVVGALVGIRAETKPKS